MNNKQFNQLNKELDNQLIDLIKSTESLFKNSYYKELNLISEENYETILQATFEIIYSLKNQSTINPISKYLYKRKMQNIAIAVEKANKFERVDLYENC